MTLVQRVVSSAGFRDHLEFVNRKMGQGKGDKLIQPKHAQGQAHSPALCAKNAEHALSRTVSPDHWRLTLTRFGSYQTVARPLLGKLPRNCRTQRREGLQPVRLAVWLKIHRALD